VAVRVVGSKVVEVVCAASVVGAGHRSPPADVVCPDAVVLCGGVVVAVDVIEVTVTVVVSKQLGSGTGCAHVRCVTGGSGYTRAPPPHPQHATSAVRPRLRKSMKAPQYQTQPSP